jgi:hypothetical protein
MQSMSLVRSIVHVSVASRLVGARISVCLSFDDDMAAFQLSSPADAYPLVQIPEYP